MEISKNAWVIVVKSDQFFVYRNVGSSDQLKLEILPWADVCEGVSASPDDPIATPHAPLTTRTIGDQFLYEISMTLNRRCLSSRIDGLYVVASRLILTKLRNFYPKDLYKFIRKEIAFDDAGGSRSQLENFLKQV